jgi:protein-tyrosine sulfotransferase
LPGIKDIIVEVLDELELVVDDDGEPDFIFIGGSGRCGTTLMRTMLNSHSRIHCGPERKLVGAISVFRNQWAITSRSVMEDAGVSVEAVDEACAAFVETLMKSTNDGSPRIAEKTPSVLLHSKFLSNAFPRAKFIHLIRDGRAVVASLLRQNWFDATTGKRLEYCQNVEAATQYWMKMMINIREQAAELGDAYMEVKYEDLVADSRGVSDKVLAFLGEPWEQSVLEQHRFKHDLPESESTNAEILRPINSDAVAKWKTELKPEQILTIERMAGPMLRELGYME